VRGLLDVPFEVRRVVLSSFEREVVGEETVFARVGLEVQHVRLVRLIIKCIMKVLSREARPRAYHQGRTSAFSPPTRR